MEGIVHELAPGQFDPALVPEAPIGSIKKDSTMACALVEDRSTGSPHLVEDKDISLVFVSC